MASWSQHFLFHFPAFLTLSLSSTHQTTQSIQANTSSTLVNATPTQAQVNMTPPTPLMTPPTSPTTTTHQQTHDTHEDSDSKYFEALPDKPVQLVRPDPLQHLGLEIVDENVRHLHHIKTAVAVVAVVGKFHSGKSFLLNQLMQKQEGFGIGPYVRPQTMGIWMWGKVYLCVQVNSVVMLHDWGMYRRKFIDQAEYSSDV